MTISWSRTGGEARCKLGGELDLATEPRVRRELLDALHDGPTQLVIDLADVTFIDSTGLRALLSARNRASSIGTRVVLSHLGPAVERTLAIANLWSFFDFEPAR
jgi:anti-anti-sigma factor